MCYESVLSLSVDTGYSYSLTYSIYTTLKVGEREKEGSCFTRFIYVCRTLKATDWLSWREVLECCRRENCSFTSFSRAAVNESATQNRVMIGEKRIGGRRPCSWLGSGKAHLAVVRTITQHRPTGRSRTHSNQHDAASECRGEASSIDDLTTQLDLGRLYYDEQWTLGLLSQLLLSYYWHWTNSTSDCYTHTQIHLAPIIAF